MDFWNVQLKSEWFYKGTEILPQIQMLCPISLQPDVVCFTFQAMNSVRSNSPSLKYHYDFWFSAQLKKIWST